MTQWLKEDRILLQVMCIKKAQRRISEGSKIKNRPQALKNEQDLDAQK